MQQLDFGSQGLNYKLYRFPPTYRDLILYAVEIQGTPTFQFERILPSLGIQLIINLNQDLKAHFRDKPGVVQLGEYSLQGHQFSFFDSYLPVRTHFFIVAFSTQGLQQLLQLPAGELANTFTHDLGKHQLQELTERITSASSGNERVMIIQNWVNRNFRASRKQNIDSLIEQTLIHEPYINQTELERLFGYTAKYLNRRFKAYSGYTISNFKRLSRFYRTIAQIRSGQDSNWLDIIHSQGFFDQSHFIKEIREFTGLTPSELKPSLASRHNNPIFQPEDLIGQPI